MYIDLSEFVIPAHRDTVLARGKVCARKDGGPPDEEFWRQIVVKRPYMCEFGFPFKNPVRMGQGWSPGSEDQVTLLRLVKDLRSGFYCHTERELTQMSHACGILHDEYIKEDPWPKIDYPGANLASPIKDYKLALVGVHIEEVDNRQVCRPVYQEGFRLDHVEERTEGGMKYNEVLVAPI
jgi:hypothetical protein